MADDEAPDAEKRISISAAATAIGVNKSTLSRQIKAGRIRLYPDETVLLSEVIADRAANVNTRSKGGLGTWQPAAAGAKSEPAKRMQRRALQSGNATRNATVDATPLTNATANATPDATVLTAPDPFISIGAAARAIGLNKSTLKRQIDSGALRSENGRVRLSEVLEDRAKNIDLRQSRKPPGKRGRTVAAPEDEGAGENDLGQLEMILVDGKLLPFAQAQQLKENYLALSRRLEYLIKSGSVVDRRAAEELFFSSSRQLRDAWLSWAPRVSILMAADLGVDASLLSETLNRYVRQHLDELGKPSAPKLLAADGQLGGGMGQGVGASAPSVSAGVGGDVPASVEGE